MGEVLEALRMETTTRVADVARAVLLERNAETWACLPAARAGDPEAGIHDMRVAAKRLREAMRLFRDVYPRKAFGTALEHLEGFNDDLGDVRDGDVLLEALEPYRGERSGVIDGLAEQLAKRRAKHQTRLNEDLDRLAAEGYPAELHELFADGGFGPDDPLASQPIAWFAEVAIGHRLARVCQRLRYLGGTNDAEALHDVRKANKHLRYAIEPVLPIFGDGLTDAYRAVVKLHSALGDLHDTDILIERIQKYASKDSGRGRVRPVLDVLRRQRDELAENCGRLCRDGGDVARRVVAALS